MECLEPDSYKKAPHMYVYDCGSIVAARDIPLGGASNWSKADLRVVLQYGDATWTCWWGETLFGLKREANLFCFLVFRSIKMDRSQMFGSHICWTEPHWGKKQLKTFSAGE